MSYDLIQTASVIRYPYLWNGRLIRVRPKGASNDCGCTASSQRVTLHAPDQISASRDRLDNVGASAKRTIDRHLRSACHHVHDLGNTSIEPRT